MKVGKLEEQKRLKKIEVSTFERQNKKNNEEKNLIGKQKSGKQKTRKNVYKKCHGFKRKLHEENQVTTIV